MSFDESRNFFAGVDDEQRRPPVTRPADDAMTFADGVYLASLPVVAELASLPKRSRTRI